MAKPSGGVHFEISANASDAIKQLGNVEKSLNDTQKAAKDLQGTLKNSGSVQLIDSQTGQDIREQVETNINDAIDHLQTQAQSKAGMAAKDAVSAWRIYTREHEESRLRFWTVMRSV